MQMNLTWRSRITHPTDYLPALDPLARLNEHAVQVPVVIHGAAFTAQDDLNGTIGLLLGAIDPPSFYRENWGATLATEVHAHVTTATTVIPPTRTDPKVFRWAGLASILLFLPGFNPNFIYGFINGLGCLL